MEISIKVMRITLSVYSFSQLLARKFQIYFPICFLLLNFYSIACNFDQSQVKARQSPAGKTV